MDRALDHVIIIGTGPGLGSSLARAAAGRGARITVIARTPASILPLAQELADAGTDVEAACADAAHEPEFRAVLGDVIARRGAPSLLVYNAVDPTPEGTGSTLAPERLTMSLETNVSGALAAVQETLEPMRSGGGGTIILTGGVLATRPYAPMTALSVGKAAIRALAMCLHQELGDEDPVHLVTVTIGGVIRPGGAFDPDRIAARMLDLHGSRESGERGEIEYRGERSPRPAPT